MRRNKKSGINKERIIMLASSAFVLAALTMTGVYMKGQNVESRDDGYTLDFTALPNNADDKLQEITEKRPQIPEDAKFHMIGHLQTNKVGQVIDKVVLIHSCDSVHLAEKIEKEAAKRDMIANVLLEVNVAREESKFGMFLEDVIPNLKEIQAFPHVCVKGMMTIAPNVENAEENRKYFKELYQLYVDIKNKNIDNGTMSVLSMGMTGDFEVAVEEGATMIRVGTGIFGSR
jgi:pyridoxal phosphate enzyme (YggS family)